MVEHNRFPFDHLLVNHRVTCERESIWKAIVFALSFWLRYFRQLNRNDIE